MIYPNPRHLRAFVAVATSRSFSDAARALYIGQPALSQAISNLEEMVGVKLLERTTRAVRLTIAGEEFLIDAQRVLEENERLLLHGTQWAKSQRGRIAVLSIPSVAHRLLPGIVREFSAQHPGVSVEVHDHADPVLRQRMARGEGDLAILTRTDDAPGNRVLPFLRDRFRFICHAAHPLAGREKIDGSQLAGERLILLRRGALFRSYVDAVIGRLILEHPPLEVDQTSTLIGMVDAGLGVSILPGLSCPPVTLRSVVTRTFVRPEVSRIVGFARPTDRAPMPVVESFVNLARAWIGEQPSSLPEGVDMLPIGVQATKRFFATPAAGRR